MGGVLKLILASVIKECSFTLGKKNKMGHAKHKVLADIPKDKFRDLSWLRQSVTKRVILRMHGTEQPNGLSPVPLIN